eukprot:11305032-Heterocapsa_arctica.AAC.1
MISNVGAKVIARGLGGSGGIGFVGLEDAESAEMSSYGRLKALIHEELKNFFRSEFLGRIDEIIVLKSL